jgi:hypothetical protein
MSMHRPSHYQFAAGDLVKKNVLLKRTENNEEMPASQSCMTKITVRANMWMMLNESNSGLNGVEIAFRNF